MKQVIPQSARDYDRDRIIERPNGFYWQSEGSRRETGPFPTLVEAVADMQASDEAGYEPGESLGEAENELGISDWIDPDTGEPAEESIPRLEDH